MCKEGTNSGRQCNYGRRRTPLGKNVLVVYNIYAMGSVIAQIVGWAKPDPKHRSVTNTGVPTTVTLDRHSRRFSDDKSPQGGNPDDPRGTEMESEMMMKTPIGQIWRRIKGLR
jgi:hypothetical protein